MADRLPSPPAETARVVWFSDLHSRMRGTMKLRGKSFKVWLGSAAVLTGLFLAAPPAAAHNLSSGLDLTDPDKDKDKDNDKDKDKDKKTIPSPEPATLMLIALGGGALALARSRRKSGRSK